MTKDYEKKFDNDEVVRVRPHDGEKSIWVVDVYDGRGVWQSSSYGPCDMTKKEAFRKAATIRKRMKKVNK